jgi:TonB family protein
MKKLTLVLFFAIATLTAIAQELTVTKYWTKNGDSTGKDNAFNYSIITYTDASKIVYTTKYYSIDGHLKSEISYRDTGKNWIYEGNYLAYHDNGKPKITAVYIKGKLNGEVTTWHANGKIKRKDVYELDSLITGQCYTATGQDTAWFPFKISFSYGKGMQEISGFVGRNIKYPKSAKKNEIQGEVRIQFVIQKDGSLTNEKIRKSVNEEIDEEAMRVFRLIPARWHPALIDGEPTRGYGILPVRFKLER